MASFQGDRRESASGVQVTLVATVVGALAYVLGFVVTGLLVDARVSRDFGRASEILGQVGELGLSPPSGLQVAGWFYYATHFVEVTLSGQLEGVGTVSTAVGVQGSAAWTDALYLVPVVVLVLAGVVVAAWADTGVPLEGALRGASVALGYFPIFVVGVFLAGWSLAGPGGLSLSATPALLPAFVAGAVYPLVFGGIGGALGHFVGERSR